MTVSMRHILMTLSAAALAAGLAPTASAGVLRETGSGQDWAAHHDGDSAGVTGDALHGFIGGAGSIRSGRRLHASFVKRTSSKISRKATSEVTVTSSDTGAPMATEETTSRTEFTKRIANKGDNAKKGGDFASPFVEELFLFVKADKDGVTEKKRKTVTRTPAPKGKDKGLDPEGKVVVFPRVPADFSKLKAGKVTTKKVRKVVKKATKMPAPKAQAKASPPPPPPRKKTKSTTTRTRARSSSRRGRDVAMKPPSSGSSRRKVPKAPQVKAVKQLPPKVKAPVSKKTRGVSRFEKFKSSLKARGTTSKSKYGFTVFK